MNVKLLLAGLLALATTLIHIIAGGEEIRLFITRYTHGRRGKASLVRRMAYGFSNTGVFFATFIKKLSYSLYA